MFTLLQTYIFLSVVTPRNNKFHNFSRRVVGLFDFTQPLYFLRSPELVKQLTVKDFSHFQDHNLFIDPETDPFFGSMLFAMEGKQWRDMRSSLSPVFTGSKMRMMMELVVKCAKQFTDFIVEEHEKKGLQTYGLKNILSRYTNDAIATCAFGVECDSLKHPKNEIYLVGQALLAFQKPTVTAKFMIMRLFPTLAKILKLKVLDDKTQNVFKRMIIDTMDVRKREGIVRPDMLQILMNMRDGQVKEHEHDNKGNDHNGHVNENGQNGERKENGHNTLNGDLKRSWTDMELIAQCFLFFLGGFDTSSNVMVYLAYELAVNPDIQQKLIESIEETHEELNGKPLTYETLKKIKYLEMVIMETLRKWPPALAADRKCVQTYNYEGDDGLKFTIEKDSIIWLPIYGFHMDPNIYPNPEQFDPERFNEDNKSKIDSYTFLPFGSGPRNCIGLRFALMQIKVLLYYLLLKCKLNVCEETQIPLKFKTSPFALIPEKEIKLHIEPRKDSKFLVVGMFDFTLPVYFLRSPELVKHLTVKEFAHFQDHNLFIDAEADPFFGSMLFAMEGKQWRDMRSSLSPVFTGSKMRMMMELVVKCAKQFTDFIVEEHEKKGLQTYGLKNIFSRFTNDSIATCAFGVECDSLRHPKNEIFLIGQALLAFQKPTMTAKFMIMRLLPRLAKILGLKVLDEKTQQTFRRMIIDTMDFRKREGIVRPDMLQILMNMRDGQVKEHEHDNKGNDHNGHVNENGQNGDIIDNGDNVLNGDVKRTWSEMELIAQCFLFFLGGFDTTSNVLIYLGYELALNTDIQERLIESIEETHEELNGKPLTYDTLKKMKYLEMVIMETLRKWPPGLAADRKCVQTYNYEGEDGLKFTIEKDSIIWLPIYGFHMDPNIYPNPEKFDPERFSEENKSNIDQYAFLPFGSGPRNCIGLRFALMEIKVLMYHLLLKCKLSVCEETQIPLTFKTSPFALIPEKEIKLHIEPRKDRKFV